MKKGILTLSALLLVAAAGVASAEKVVVIVNAANTQGVTATDLKNMYNDIVIHWSNDQPIDMYDTPVAAEARKIFSGHEPGRSRTGMGEP